MQLELSLAAADRQRNELYVLNAELLSWELMSDAGRYCKGWYKEEHVVSSIANMSYVRSQ